MPASLGTAIHNTVEDLCNLDISNRDEDEVGWFHSTAKDVLERNWKAERKQFMDTPRHPRWKTEMLSKAHDGLVGALGFLFEKAGLPKLELSDVSIQVWRQVQGIVLATEATLESDCGRLMGRLDLLILDPDREEEEGWIVADLKTGRPPRSELDAKVRRQLLFYRDLMKQRSPEHKSIVAEGWYSSNETAYVADGPSRHGSRWRSPKHHFRQLPVSPLAHFASGRHGARIGGYQGERGYSVVVGPSETK